MEIQMDLFELLQMMTGAPQISDLPHAPYQRWNAWTMLLETK